MLEDLRRVERSAETEPTMAFPRFVCRMSSGLVSAWIHVAGELDFATAPEFASVLSDAGRDALLIAVDMRGITFIDSSGLAVMASAAQRALRLDQQIVAIVMPGSQVHRLLDFTGLNRQLGIIDDPVAPVDPPTATGRSPYVHLADPRTSSSRRLASRKPVDRNDSPLRRNEGHA